MCALERLFLSLMAQISMAQISTNEPDGVGALVLSCVEEGAGDGNFQIAAVIIREVLTKSFAVKVDLDIESAFAVFKYFDIF